MERYVGLLLHLKFVLSELHCHVRGTQFYWWRISNEGEDDVLPLAILVFGREMIADDVVAAFFSNRGFKKVRLAQCSPRSAGMLLASYRDPDDAIVIMEKPWWRQSVVEGQALFQSLLDTSLKINGRKYEEILDQDMGKRSKRKLGRSIDKSPPIRETRKVEDILNYRQGLLASSAKMIHGEQANVPSEGEIKALADKLILFLMEEDARPVAGELSIYSERTSNLRLWRIGMTEELIKNSSLKSQYSAAFFARALEMACDMGLSSISHGLTSPVLNHGNLTYKLRFACRPVIIPQYPRCVISFETEYLPDVLDRHPLLVIENDELVGMMGVNHDLAPDAVKEHFNSFFKSCTYRELERILCVVHAGWYDNRVGKMLHSEELELYDLNHIKRQGNYVWLSFNRRQGA